MFQNTLLVIDDEKDTRDSLQCLLSKTFKVLIADSTTAAIEILKTAHPDAILCDLQMPGLDGIELCKFVRQHPEHKNTPIMIVSAVGSEASRTECFHWGADDFLAKPFSGSELIARVLAKLRWARQPIEESVSALQCGNMNIDERKFEVCIDGSPIKLTVFEFKLLKYFVSHKNIVLKRDEVVREIWENSTVTNRTVDVHVHALRNKLDKFNHEFHTIHGLGYILRER